LAKAALPTKPPEPTSASDQGKGRPLFTAAVTVKLKVVELVKLPDAPVTVTVTVPAEAVLLAIRVKVLEAAVGFGLKEGVTPLGSPDADKLTPALKPLSGVMVIVVVPLAPCAIVTLLGGESVKLGTALTVSENDVLAVKVPEVPVTVTVTVPAETALPTIRVSVLEVVAGFGLKDAITPMGSPEADKLTLALKPLSGVTVIVLVPLAP
jgi:hypothetical protein